MNTTDKSIALVDIALRRRFTFIEMEPKADLIENVVLKEFFKELNEQIKYDLDVDHKIGHSYFMGKTEKDLQVLWKNNIYPLIKEYFYGDDDKIEPYQKLYDKYNKSN
jgi:5-methylcytosine-specific restriction protein B